MNNKIKKNILDLEYNKDLQYSNTIVVIIFTYFIGLFIALTTNRFIFNLKEITLIITVSILILSTTTLLLLIIKSKLKKIINEITNLSI